MTSQTPILASSTLTGQAFLAAEIAASTIAREMTSAFWLLHCGHNPQQFTDAADKQLHTLAGLLGYDLTPRAQKGPSHE